MALQPIQPQDNNRLGKFLTIGGAAVGALAGPQGAVAGAGVGSTLGGIVSRPPVQSVESQGMDQRRQVLDQDPVSALNQASAILNNIPQGQLPETRRAFENALAIAQKNQQLGRGGF